ncbi:MAG: hypothetical protein QXG01_08640, partial [Candidatus Bathyarchaeia archaeon]
MLVLAGAHYFFNVLLPKHSDTDKDGLNDYDEQHTYKTEKNNPDSDNDKLLDGYNLTLANDSDLAKKF